MLALGVTSMVAIDLIILTTYTIVEGINGNLTAIEVSYKESPTVTEGVSYMHVLIDSC